MKIFLPFFINFMFLTNWQMTMVILNFMIISLYFFMEKELSLFFGLYLFLSISLTLLSFLIISVMIISMTSWMKEMKASIFF